MKENKILKILVPVVLLLIIFAAIGKKKGWFGKEATVKVAVEKVAVNSDHRGCHSQRQDPARDGGQDKS